MNKKKYVICLRGCDDITEFEIELDEKELELVNKISELSLQTSTYGCMPDLTLSEVQEDENVC